MKLIWLWFLLVLIRIITFIIINIIICVIWVWVGSYVLKTLHGFDGDCVHAGLALRGLLSDVVALEEVGVPILG